MIENRFKVMPFLYPESPHCTCGAAHEGNCGATQNTSKDLSKQSAARRAVPGKRTIRNFLLTALEPVGSTMYVWGGGWNESDDGAGIEAVTIGVSPEWRAFSLKQDAAYDFEKTRYQIHDGLDCSGYVGWVVYNVLHTESGGEGYVASSTEMTDLFASRGFGSSLPYGNVTDIQPGDILSMKGHVWIAAGVCTDGSCVILHASPAGVALNGTKTPYGGDRSEAILLAEHYMHWEYPEWFSRFPDCTRDASFFLASRFRWNSRTLTDPDGMLSMNAEDVLINLYGS